MSHAHAEIKVKGQSVHKIDWKQTTAVLDQLSWSVTSTLWVRLGFTKFKG